MIAMAGVGNGALNANSANNSSVISWGYGKLQLDNVRFDLESFPGFKNALEVSSVQFDQLDPNLANLVRFFILFIEELITRKGTFRRVRILQIEDVALQRQRIASEMLVCRPDQNR